MSFKAQPPRKYNQIDGYDISELTEKIKIHSKENNFSIDQSLKVFEILELKRKNDLSVNNGDIMDENFYGFAEILENLVLAIEDLSEK